MRMSPVIVGLAGLGILAGRAEPAESSRDPGPTPSGSLRGRVTIDGKSEARRFKIEDGVLSLSGEGLAQASPPPSVEPVVMDQKDITYVPHVLPIVAGTVVEFRNSDNTLHNVHSHCAKNRTFNLAMTSEQEVRVTFDKAEVVTLTCNVHAEMKAYIVVIDNAFFSKPAQDGTYAIAGIPPGTYKLRAWHEALGPVVRDVTIKAGEETTVDIDFDSRKKPVRDGK